MANAGSILIVDADPMTTEGIRRIVTRQAPWKILEARNFVEAKTANERSRPDIIVIHNKRPQLDGVQVTQAILNFASDSKVLFLAHDNSMVHSAFGAGALGYLSRKQMESDLLAAIEQILLGRTFFTAEVVRLLRLRHHRNPYPGEHKTLTPREVTILQQIALGTPNKDIATAYGISIRTVENHRAAIMEKLGLKNLSELVRYAVRTGLIEM